MQRESKIKCIYILLPNLIVASKVDRVFQPLAEHDLETVVTTNVDLAKELDHVAGSIKAETGENQDERLDERCRLGTSQACCDRLQQVSQVVAQTLVSSLLDQLGGESANFRGRVILDSRVQQPSDDVEADLETAVALLILPAKDLLVVMHEHELERARTGPQNLALVRLHKEAFELRAQLCDETRG